MADSIPEKKEISYEELLDKKEISAENNLDKKESHLDRGVLEEIESASEVREAPSKQRERIYALKFAAVISVVCCMLLTGASVGLRGFQLENMELDRQKNILKAAGILHQEDHLSKMQIQQIYRDKIREVAVGSDGVVYPSDDTTGKSGERAADSREQSEQRLPLYLYEGKAYIIPIESKGLWGKIYGYLAFENDGVTIAGFTVYSHSETPGLGGEIEKGWFQKNFTGKKIINSANQFVSVAIAKGDASNLPEEDQLNHVDGISGATLTGKYLTQGLRENLEQYEAVSVKLRQGEPLE